MMKKFKVLVVEDEGHWRERLRAALKDHDINLTMVDNAASAKQKLAAEKPDICFIDLSLGEEDPFSGLQLISAAKGQGAYAVVFSGHDDEARRDSADRHGCDEFLSKREGPQAVSELINRFISKRTNLLNDDLYSYALNQGLYSLLDLITDLVISRNLNDSKGVQTKVLRNLRITNRILYTSLRRQNVPQPRKRRAREA